MHRSKPLPGGDNLQCDGLEFVCDAPAERIRGLPAPACGRYVIARQIGRDHKPLCEQLALRFRGDDGGEVLLACTGDNPQLLTGDWGKATWLPEGWKLSAFPAGWALSQLVAWSDLALTLAEQDHQTRGHPTAPNPRELVAHAYLLVRHLYRPDAPAEPHGPVDRDGSLAELWNVRAYVRRVLNAPSMLATPPMPAYLSAADLARLWGLQGKKDSEALGKRLARWRASRAGMAAAGEGWIEAEEPRCRQARYLYRVSAVQHLQKP